jgi:anti-sigma regulatory factor (Ser/Thr protein kinase)
MPPRSVEVKISNTSTHSQIINSLSPFFSAKKGDKIDVYLEFDPNNSFIYPDHLLLISSAINSTSKRGVQIMGEIFCKPECEDYVSRMNFYDSVGIKFQENFTRNDAFGRFLEISQFQDDTESNRLVNCVVNILQKQQITDDQMLASLQFCLAELVGNVVEHSTVEKKLPLELGGWVVAQYYPRKKSIRIMIADNGQGIFKSLTTNPKDPKYKLYTPRLCMEECVIKGVTNGSGCGNGLYIASNFIQKNGGELYIHSGSHALRYTKEGKRVYATHNWQGTIVFLQINSDITVNVEDVLDGYTDFYDDYKEWFPNKNVKEFDNLW